MNTLNYSEMTEILKEELVPALGCTEPIAIAYGSAVARKILGEFPTKIKIYASGNIIKNVKSVIVPTTNDLYGIEASAILGAVGGNADKKLEVLSDVTEKDVDMTRELLKEEDFCTVAHLVGSENLHIIVKLIGETNVCKVELSHTHTNITKITFNGEVTFESRCEGDDYDTEEVDNNTNLSVSDIFEYANNVEISQIKDLLDMQINYNLSICNEGLMNNYGARVGQIILKTGMDIFSKCRAYAAAGSDARMGGCTFPVVINSGSGNQGITVSIPVILYAQYIGANHEQVLRALALSNLIAIHQKSGIGKLSAYCGAVSAGCAASCGIAYLDGQNQDVLEKIITNTLATVAGIICDGAKASCASKIASSLDAGFLAYQLAKEKISFKEGDGIVKGDIEATISSFARMGREGMRGTDQEILSIMLEN